MLSRITGFIHAYGAVAGMQLAHAGRKGSAMRPWEGGRSLSDEEGGWETVGPSPIRFGGRNNELWRIPHELTEEEIDTRTAYQVPFAERVLKEAEVPTAAVGSITAPKVAEEILQKGQATLIFLARAMLDDPYWPLHASFELGSRSEISLPPPYEYVLQNPVIAAHN